MASWSMTYFLMQITIWFLDLRWKRFWMLLKNKWNIVFSVSTKAEPNRNQKKKGGQQCFLQQLPHITINYVSDYQEGFCYNRNRSHLSGNDQTVIFCEAVITKTVKGNWKLACYLMLAMKLKKVFQNKQNDIKVGKFGTHNDDIIFEPSDKSKSKTSELLLQGMEIPSDALYWLWCKAAWISSSSPRVIGSVILQI